jgi:predicted nucleic acid-binding protein
VVVAGLTSWHVHHDLALPVLTMSPAAIQHVLAEAYAVLTRLPKGRGVKPATALRAIRSAFGSDRLTLTSADLERLLERLAQAEIAGGATYDAIVAETARLADAHLITLDRRASRTYEAVGVRFSLLAT